MIEDRIVGGKNTKLDQFAWTVLLNIIFSRSREAKIFDIEITLAEYDKRTFPRDCANIEIGLSKNRKCIDNVLMHAKNIIIHPEYDDDRLDNDIALIEIDGYAPYTRHIRPICLPSINLDDPEFSNLPLTAVGWGRNGIYNTNVKKSTIVHLVPHDECEISYPYLSIAQICAAGHTGEVTCKGDSGGPLMLQYRTIYYVVGVVSGKRSDSPCGSSVPSLYSNVYYYVPWIRSVIES
ncbi:unnamed protein product [Euphydryas editha]|uniref:Peptidase S1 domain-containing protein n=1 Tax=Euphydryas editha TaxID=104508 RepID=A0AAU9V9C7_EUPED|nr:unnamed protein product [Euphydryas editha]